MRREGNIRQKVIFDKDVIHPREHFMWLDTLLYALASPLARFVDAFTRRR